MVNQLHLPYQALSELLEALGILFAGVKPESLASPTAARHLRQVLKWREQVQTLLPQHTASEESVDVPAFPISGAELSALRSAVHRLQTTTEAASMPSDEAEHVHQAEIHALPQSAIKRLHGSMGWVHQTSFALVTILVISLALNLATVFFAHVSHVRALLLANLGATCLALVIWVLHRLALTRHFDLFHHLVIKHHLRHHAR